MPYSFRALPEAHTVSFPPAYLVLVPCVALALTSLASTLSASQPAIELPRV